jgi:hypothetical protein
VQRYELFFKLRASPSFFFFLTEICMQIDAFPLVSGAPHENLVPKVLEISEKVPNFAARKHSLFEPTYIISNRE